MFSAVRSAHLSQVRRLVSLALEGHGVLPVCWKPLKSRMVVHELENLARVLAE